MTDTSTTGRNRPHLKLLKAGNHKAPSEPHPPRPQGRIDALLAGNPALWRGCDMAGRGDHGQPTGFAQLDAVLPGRGWPRSAMVEIVSPRWGMGELQLLVPLMRQVMAEGKWILWISPPYLLYTPALLQAGINIRRLLVIDLETSCKDALWSMEKALQTESCALVLAWQNWLPDKVVRRLQLAAETGQTLGVLFQHRVSEHSHSSLRLKIEAFSGFHRSSEGNDAGPEEAGDTQVTVLRARGNFRPLSTRLTLHRQPLPL